MSSDEILKGFSKAKADRTVWENTWEDVTYYIVPRKRGIQESSTPGDKPPYDVYDDTAIHSNIILAAGLSGYLTNAAQRWFELRPRNEELMNKGDIQTFFNDSADVMYSHFANSNFYQQSHEFYLDLGSIGTACLYEEEDAKEDIRFYARHPKEVYCIENDREIVDMVYRYFKLTAWQAYKLFGKDNVGDTIVKSVEEQKDYGKTYDFIHYVCPRDIRDVGKKDAKNLPYASYWVNESDKKIVKEGGYEEFPFFVTRFYKNSTEVYGYSPGFACYPDIRMINKMMETYIKAAEIAIFPPWLLEHDGMIGTLDLRAGALNYQKQMLSQGEAVKPLISGSNFQVAIDFLQRTEANIKAAYFVDLFLMLVQQNDMTATEVMERSQEKMLMLGPVLGRLQSECLNPIIYRTFNILQRRGKLPPIPPELQGQEYDVVYVSPLAKAQRAVQAKDTQMFISLIGQMATFAPQVLDKLNTDEAIDKLSRIYAIDPKIVNDDDAVEEIRTQRAKQQQQQMMMANMLNAATVAKTTGEASKGFADAASSSASKKTS